MSNWTFSTFGAAALLTALVAFGASIPANAESVAKECGDDWKQAKEDGTTNGRTWAEFYKSCKAQKTGAAERAAALPRIVRPTPVATTAHHAPAPASTTAKLAPKSSPPLAVAANTPTASVGQNNAFVSNLDKRFALVIGNSNYPNATLANPLFDADLVAGSLRKVGFDVTEVKDADFAAFDFALTDFVAKEAGAEIALFYFAGHGFAIQGEDLKPRNYLMSTSANLRSTSDAVLRRDGISIDEVIKRISAPAKVTLAFVDACRNDPFHRGAGDRGFQPIEVALAQQVFIGMSTQLGKTALDGDYGKGSPFARAFVEKMSTPGLRVDDAFRALRAEVSRMTDGTQKPEILQDDLQEGALVLVRSP